jgi:hypothetical protein
MLDIKLSSAQPGQQRTVLITQQRLAGDNTLRWLLLLLLLLLLGFVLLPVWPNM